jgi:hypothetical protein
MISNDNYTMKLNPFLLTVCLLALPLGASAQRFSVGTNAVDWITLGTINAEASVAASQHISVHIGAELNPWTFRAGEQDRQFQIRQNSYWGGVRWWPWHVYSGWWAGGDLRYTVYNEGGIIKRETEEGNAFGAGAYGGYSIMLSEWWNLDLGFGILGGWKRYTRYACPLCGVVVGSGDAAFFVPDARIAIQLIF